MPVLWRIRFRLLVLCLALPGLLTQCGSFKPQSRNARDAAATVKESSDEKGTDDNGEASPKEEEKDDAKKEKEQKKLESQRVIAVDQTPFFKWLRSGLRSNAKPSRYLSKGDLVELLKENEEDKFSQIRLADRKKGWVPSRLLKTVMGTDASAETPNPETSPEENSTEDPKVKVPEDLPPAGPAELPDNDSVQPSLSSDELGEPLFPGFNIIQPKRQPKETNPKPTEEAAAPTADEAASLAKPDAPSIN